MSKTRAQVSLQQNQSEFLFKWAYEEASPSQTWPQAAEDAFTGKDKEEQKADGERECAISLG